MKFQDSSFNSLKGTVCTKSVTHAPTNGRSKSNMPQKLFQSWGHNLHIYIDLVNSHLLTILGDTIKTRWFFYLQWANSC